MLHVLILVNDLHPSFIVPIRAHKINPWDTAQLSVPICKDLDSFTAAIHMACSQPIGYFVESLFQTKCVIFYPNHVAGRHVAGLPVMDLSVGQKVDGKSLSLPFLLSGHATPCFLYFISPSLRFTITVSLNE